MIKITCYCSGSSGNLYLIKNSQTKILLECGVEPKTIRKFLRSENTNIGELNGCLISHKHSDHSQSCEYLKDYIDIYSSQSFFTDKRIDGKVIENKVNFKIGDISIKPLLVNHGKCECLAFIFKDKDNCIFWATDFSILCKNGEEKILDLSSFKFNEVWIECNYIKEYLSIKLDNEFDKMKYQRQINTHMSLDNCIKHLKTFNLEKCKRINLIHVSQDVGDYKLMEQEVYNEFKIPTKAMRCYNDNDC